MAKFPGGVKFPIAFFGTFQDVAANPRTPRTRRSGCLVTAGLGSFLPAWNAGSRVKASDVFSQVA